MQQCRWLRYTAAVVPRRSPSCVCCPAMCCAVLFWCRLLELVTESLGLVDASFQRSLPSIISWLHGERKACSSRQSQLKSWYSRLLFLLSRCSRLLTTDEEGVDAAGSGSAAQIDGGTAAAAITAMLGSSQGCSAASSSQVSPKILQLLGRSAPFLGGVGAALGGDERSSSAVAAVAPAGSGTDASSGVSVGAAAASSGRGGLCAQQQLGGCSSAGGSEEAGSQASRGHRARRRSALGEPGYATSAHSD